MPYSIFYNGHYAVHGTDQVGRLGRPASSGCIRLHPSNAAVLYGLAQREGLENTKIVVVR
jgi:lipoprotein-anchoring transpeptidase ErfK/SrfK